MGKYLNLVVFVVLTELTCCLQAQYHYDYEDEDALTIGPPTLQPGCVLRGRPCGSSYPACCPGNDCTQTAIMQSVYTGLGIVDFNMYSCLKRGQKPKIKIFKIGQTEKEREADYKG